MLDHVPRDILIPILSKLDTASLVGAATTCRALRDAAECVTSLRLHMTPRTHDGLLHWLSVRQNSRKISFFRVSRAISSSSFLGWIRALENLKSFITAFCRVPASIFSELPTQTLLSLNIHQLHPGLGGDVFTTRVLTEFTALRRIHISFAPGWSLALVGPGLETLTSLETFEVRRIPAVAVTHSIPATSHVALHAFDVMSSQIPVAPRATSLSLLCDDAPIDTLEEMLGDETIVRNLRSLTLASTGMLRIPYLYDMIHLKHLHIWTTLYYFPELDRLLNLKKLIIDVDSSFVFDHVSSLPPSIVCVRATAQGTPVDIYDYLRQDTQDVGEL